MEKTKYNAFLVAFYNMLAVTFVLPDEMADKSIAGLHGFILIPQLNHTGSHRPSASHSKSYFPHRKKAVIRLSY